MTTILITGATGDVGSHVVAQLATKPGLTVRGAVHSPGPALKITAAGATPVLFDWDAPATFGPALAGVDKVFLLSPMVPHLAKQVRDLLGAARAAGVRHVVRMSALGADPKSPICLGRWHGDGDEAVRAAGIPYTIVRPANFMQNFINVYPPDAQGSIYLPWGQGKVSFVDTSDVAAVIVAALVDSGHEGKVYDVTGPEGISAAQGAQAIGQASGRKVQYIEVPEAAAQEAMMGKGMPEHLVQALMELNAVCKAGHLSAVTPTVQAVTGRAPKSFTDFAREHAASWGGGER